MVPPATDFGLIPNLRFSFADSPMILKTGGWSREITSRELSVDDTMAVVDMNLSPGVREMHTHLQSEFGYVLQGGARVEVEPGGMREIHWHSNADELQYYIQGKARMTVFKPGPKARTFNFQAGDVGYVPVGNFHYVQNIGNEKLIFLEVFKSNHFADLSLAQWIAMTPREVVKSVLNLSDKFIDNLRMESTPVVKYPGYERPAAKNTPQNTCYFENFDYKIKHPPTRAVEAHDENS